MLKYEADKYYTKEGWQCILDLESLELKDFIGDYHLVDDCLFSMQPNRNQWTIIIVKLFTLPQEALKAQVINFKPISSFI